MLLQDFYDFASKSLYFYFFKIKNLHFPNFFYLIAWFLNNFTLTINGAWQISFNGIFCCGVGQRVGWCYMPLMCYARIAFNAFNACNLYYACYVFNSTEARLRSVYFTSMISLKSPSTWLAFQFNQKISWMSLV